MPNVYANPNQEPVYWPIVDDQARESAAPEEAQ